MTIKLLSLIFVLLLSLIQGYDTDGDVIILTDDHFPKVVQDHPYIFIQFYTPWCVHCKKLAPVYAEVATALKQDNSQTKIDADKYDIAAKEYQVQKFPALFFFVNGTRIQYKGDRTKQKIISWVNKKILPVTIQLNSKHQYNILISKQDVSIVLFSTDSSQIEQFQKLAKADDFNKYYIATDQFKNNQISGTVKIIRKFDEIATFNGQFSTLSSWITKNSKPIILPFDQQTIQAIFGETKRAIIFINVGDEIAPQLRKAVVQEAQADTSTIIYTEFDKKFQHFKRFTDHLKVPTDRSRVIVIDGATVKKNVQIGQITPDTVHQFLRSVAAGQAQQYELTDAVDGFVDNEQNTQQKKSDEQL